MDLKTEYLGLELPHPFVVGASPLTDELDTARRLEDAGAAALVMRSLVAEQIDRENLGAYAPVEETRSDSWAGSAAFSLSSRSFVLAPDAYLEQLAALKGALGIPVIASLSGAGPGRWLDYAPLLETIGADALELNLHPGGAEVWRSSADIEASLLATVRAVRAAVKIPVAVKLPPCFSGLALLAEAIQDAGADALVLFNRAQASDIDPGTLGSVPPLALSRVTELPLRLRWLAILSCRLRIPSPRRAGSTTSWRPSRRSWRARGSYRWSPRSWPAAPATCATCGPRWRIGWTGMATSRSGACGERWTSRPAPIPRATSGRPRSSPCSAGPDRGGSDEVHVQQAARNQDGSEEPRRRSAPPAHAQQGRATPASACPTRTPTSPARCPGSCGSPPIRSWWRPEVSALRQLILRNFQSPGDSSARPQGVTSRHASRFDWNWLRKESELTKGLPPAEVAQAADVVAYQPGAVVSRELLRTPTGTVTAFAFDEGQGLSEHTTPFDALVQVLEGEAEITIAGRPHPVPGGAMILMPGGQPHALRAVRRFKMMLTMIRS